MTVDEKPDSRHFPRRLRFRGPRRDQDAAGHDDEEVASGDESMPYLIHGDERADPWTRALHGTTLGADL